MRNLWVPLDDELHQRFKDKYPRCMQDKIREWIKEDVGGSDDELTQRIIEIHDERTQLELEEKSIKKYIQRSEEKKKDRLREKWKEFRKENPKKYPAWKSMSDKMAWWSDKGVDVTYKQVYIYWNEMEEVV